MSRINMCFLSHSICIILLFSCNSDENKQSILNLKNLIIKEQNFFTEIVEENRRLKAVRYNPLETYSKKPIKIDFINLENDTILINNEVFNLRNIKKDLIFFLNREGIIVDDVFKNAIVFELHIFKTENRASLEKQLECTEFIIREISCIINDYRENKSKTLYNKDYEALDNIRRINIDRMYSKTFYILLANKFHDLPSPASPSL